MQKNGKTQGEAIAQALLTAAKEGNVNAYKEVADRTECLVPLPMIGPGGGSIRVEFSFQDNGLQTTEDELKAIDIEAMDIESDERED